MSSCLTITTQMHSYKIQPSSNLPFLHQEPEIQGPAAHAGQSPEMGSGHATGSSGTPPHRSERRITLPRILGSSRGLHFPAALAATSNPPPALPLPGLRGARGFCRWSERLLGLSSGGVQTRGCCPTGAVLEPHLTSAAVGGTAPGAPAAWAR